MIYKYSSQLSVIDIDWHFEELKSDVAAACRVGSFVKEIGALPEENITFHENGVRDTEAIARACLYYVLRTNNMHTFRINVLIQL